MQCNANVSINCEKFKFEIQFLGRHLGITTAGCGQLPSFICAISLLIGYFPCVILTTLFFFSYFNFRTLFVQFRRSSNALLGFSFNVSYVDVCILFDVAYFPCVYNYMISENPHHNTIQTMRLLVKF